MKQIYSQLLVRLRLYGFIVGILPNVIVCSESKYLRDFEPQGTKPNQTLSTPERVTAGSESNFAPNLSPNGAYVIYTSDKTGNKDLWEKSTTGGYARQLTFHSADDLHPVMSPDGTRLAFVSRREDAAGDIQILALSRMNFLRSSGSEGELDSIRSPQTEDTTPEWFPDGAKIVFSARRPGEKLPQLMTASLEDLTPVPLGETRGDQPSVSPDGRMLVYVKEGGLHTYNLDTEKIEQLTTGGYIQDGHPRFSPDGASVVFIRYSDDTNDDGFINADDRAAIWRLDLKEHSKNPQKENYALKPLTTPAYSGYNPQLRPPFLYLTLQTHNGLDIFKINEDGQAVPAVDLDDLQHQLDLTPDFWSKLYVLRLAAANFYRLGKVEFAADTALMELDLMAKNDRRQEFNWAYKKFSASFPQLKQHHILAKLYAIHLEMHPLKFQLTGLNLTADQEQTLIEIEKDLNTTLSDQSSPKGPLSEKIHAYGKLLNAQILAARREFFRSYQVIEELVKSHPHQRALAAEAQLFQASVLPATSDVANSLQKIKTTVKDYQDIRPIALAAGELSVALTSMQASDQTEVLGKLKEDAKGLPILPAIAHMKIADIFASQKKTAVYANELRQIVDLYPDSPEVALTAAERLMPLEEANGRYSQLENTLQRLHANISPQFSTFRQQAKSLLLENIQHHGEHFLRLEKYKDACSEFQKVLAIEATNVSGHRGIIDCQYKLRKFDEILSAYDEAASDYPDSAVYQYIYGYALSYLIDGQDSPRGKLSAIDSSIEQIELARTKNSQILQIHQTLGWLYFQKGYWLDRYYKSGAVIGTLSEKTGMVLSFFGRSEPNWLQLSIDSYHTAYFLSKENSYERITIALNLGQTYYELKNYQKALAYYLERIKRLSEIPLRDSKSEAILLRRAGRSAFQIDELGLAENLQQEALAKWQKINLENEVAYSLDALALTKREQGKTKDAINLYEQILAYAQRTKEPLNSIGALSNLGYCHWALGSSDKALNYYNQAQVELEGILKGDIQESDSSEGSIQVDLGGQGSAAKGFDLLARGNLIVSFKAAIYGKIGRKDLQLEQLIKKLDLLSKSRVEQMSEQGKSEKYLAEEIAITQNNIAELQLEFGKQLSAQTKFQEAEQSARLLRPEDQAYKTKGEITNALNSAKIDLRLGALKLLQNADIVKIAAELRDTAESLKPVYADGSREQGKSIAALLALSSSLKQIEVKATEQDTESLVETLKIMKNGDLPATAKPQTLLAYAFTGKDQITLTSDIAKKDPKLPAQPGVDDGQEVVSFSSLITESKKKLAEDPLHEWKVAIINKDFDKSLTLVQAMVKQGLSFKNPVDRKLIRMLFEKNIARKIEKNAPEEVFLAARRLNNFRALELLNRGLSLGTDENAAVLRSYFQEKLEPIPVEAIKGQLKAGEHALFCHRLYTGKILIFLVSTTGLKYRTISPSTGFQTQWELSKGPASLAIAAALSQAPFIGTIKKNDSVYMIPSAELHDIDWESLSVAGTPLRARNTLAFLPSIDLLGEYIATRKLTKTWIGLVTKSKDPQAGSDSPFGRLLSKDQDFEEILPDGEKPLAKAMGNYNIVHISAPMELFQAEPAKTTIPQEIKNPLPGDESDASKDEAPPENSYKDDLFVNDLFKFPTPHTLALIFTNIRKDQVERYATGEGQDGWLYLSLVALKAQIPSMILAPNKLAKDDDDSESDDNVVMDDKPWQAFYTLLSKRPIGESLQKSNIDARLYGHLGISAADEVVFAKENLEKVMSHADDAYDDGDYAAAADYYKIAQSYYDRLGKTDGDALDRIVASLYQNRDYKGALHFKKIVNARLKPAPKGQKGDDKDPVDYGNGVIEAAVLAVRAKKHEQAEKLLSEAEAIFTFEEDYAQLGKIAQYRGIDAENKKDYEKTILWYRKSQELYQKVNPGEAIGRLLNIGNIYNSRLSEYARAIEYYDMAEASFRAQGSKDYIPVLIDKANALVAIGQIDDAVILLERTVIPNIDQVKNKDLWVRSTQLLASAYLRSGLYSQAKDLNEQTIAEAQKIEDPRDKLKPISRTIDAIGLKGYILSAMGQYKQGFEEFKNAINMAQKYKLKGQLAVLYNNYGFWAREYGATDESIEFFNLALKYDEELKSKSGIAVDQRNLALSVLIKGDFSRAKDLLSESLKTSQELKLVYNAIYCHFGLGDIALREEKFALAREQFQAALKASVKYGFKEFQWKGLAGLAQANYLQKNYEQSATESAEAVAIIESLRAGLKSESSKSELQSERGVQEVYQTYAVSLMKLGKTMKAWTVAQKSRGRAFLDTFGSKKLQLSRIESQQALSDEQALRRRQDTASTYYRKLRENKASPAKIAAAKADLHNISSERAKLIKKMYQMDSQLIELVATNYVTLKEAKTYLPPQTSLMEYLVTKDHLLIWMVSHQGSDIDGRVIPLNQKDLSAKIADYRLLMQNFSSPEYLGRELSDLLLTPFKTTLESTKRLIIVPHKDLHFLSFASLPYKSQYTIDSFSLSYLESTNYLRHLSKKSDKLDPSTAKILALTNPTNPKSDGQDLFYSEKEGYALKRYWKNVEVLARSNAKESKVKSEVSTDILHIGGHGIFSNSNPESSSIILAPDDKNDGFLTINEVFGLNIRAKMVTLSACESGMGVISNGDEIIGMNRAFFYSGASTIVSALWRINDVTSAVTMKRFYRYLSEGESKDASLVKAQKVVRQYFKHPAYWAAFRVLGDWN